MLLFALLLAAGTRADAQVDAPSPLEEVDPDARAEPEPPEPEPIVAPHPAAPAEAAPAEAGPAETAPAKAAPTEAASAPTLQPAAPLLAPRVDDAQLIAAWRSVHAAQAKGDAPALDAAVRALVALREDVAATDLDPFAMALGRLAELRRQGSDAPAAVRLAEAAVALAPHLPPVHFVLARQYALTAPADAGRYGAQFVEGVRALLADPRYLRPALADVGGAALLALLATASLVLLLLFARGVRYFLHDVHHLFPRATARWQSAALALLLLSLPLVLRLGWTLLLLALFASVVLSLSRSERVLGAALLALLGLMPLAAGALARETAFAGTVAEDVYLLERGGLAAASAGARVRARDEAGRTRFAELFALGRYQARRGALEDAAVLYKRAAALRSAEPRLLTNLGNVRLALGDADGALQLYQGATQVDPSLAAAWFNLAQVHFRRAKELEGAALSEAMGQASTALATAQRLDPALLTRLPPDMERPLMNRVLLSPGLPPAELAALTAREVEGPVQAQLERLLLGGRGGPLAWALPGALAGLLLLWSLSRDRLAASRGCRRCGRSVCRRCDRELHLRSEQCGQCVNAFGRRGLIAPQVRARKQLEVERYRARMDRLTLALGAVLGGAGHLLSGLPLRGALHAFAFSFLLLGALGAHGLVRVPYGELAGALKALPLLLLLVPLHLLSLRALRRRQARAAVPEVG